MRKIVLLSLAAALAVGCATPPREIEAVAVSPETYKDRSCEQIEAELAGALARGTEMRKAIDRDAAGDAALVGVGMLLFWPAALFAIGDADEAEEYARLKGEYEALQEAGRAKNCAIEYKPLQEPAEAASATAP